MRRVVTLPLVPYSDNSVQYSPNFEELGTLEVIQGFSVLRPDNGNSPSILRQSMPAPVLQVEITRADL